MAQAENPLLWMKYLCRNWNIFQIEGVPYHEWAPSTAHSDCIKRIYWKSPQSKMMSATNTVFPPAVPFTDNELGFVSPISRSFIRTVQHFITTFQKQKRTCLQWDLSQRSSSLKLEWKMRVIFSHHMVRIEVLRLNDSPAELLGQEKVVGESFASMERSDIEWKSCGQ